jgi:membrane-associated phospholipid phosphatase
MKCGHRVPYIIFFALFAILSGAAAQNARAQDLLATQPDTASASPIGLFAGLPEQFIAQPADQKDAQASLDLPADPQSAQDNTQNSAQDSAQVQSKHRDEHLVHDFVGDFFHDEYRIWTGPFRRGSYSSHAMKKYGVPFILISGALIGTDRQTANWFPNTPNQVLWSKRVSQVGAPYTVAGISAGTYLIGRITGNRHAQETGFLSLEAVANSQFITLVLKEITQRQRPLQGVNHGGFWQGGSSFPSGHASGSFAVAAVFAYEYRDHIAIPITAYALATVVDISRMSAQQHWLSDIFVGSAVGFLTGRYVYKQHHDSTLPGSLTSRLRPHLDARAQGLGLYWDF